MSNCTYFLQECPICGRRSQIRVEYLGKKLVCRHCQGQFVATDPAARCACGEADDAVLRRAEELLQSVALRRNPPGCPYPH
jgi:hypothetical protein